MAYTRFDSNEDVILGNVVNGVTSTLFSGGASSLTAFHTSSTQTASVGGAYQFEVYNANPASDNDAEVQFSIAYI